METHRRTYFTERGIAIPAGGPLAGSARAIAGSGHGEIDLISGAMHYWRVERVDWATCLAAMKTLGLSIVETHVPWRVHEVEPGRYEFRGQRDLGSFLDRVAEAGMAAVIRPGPQINAELSLFGFPERILRMPEIRALTGQGTAAFLPAPPRMFPVPSYASRAFHAEVEAWYAAIAEILAPRLAPDGPVIAIGVDNEASMFFRLGAYDLDYHPDALAWWDEHTNGLEAPRRWLPDDPERCIRWVAFKEEYTARALSVLAGAMDRVGLGGVARFHSMAGSAAFAGCLPRVARAVAGVAGLDFHSRAGNAGPGSLARARERALYLAGTAHPLPYATEIGLGGPFWRPPGEPESELDLALRPLSCGARAFNLYMAVGRDRWYGAPIDERGELAPGADRLARLLAALAEVEWTSLSRYAPLALLASRADARVASASSYVDPVSTVLLEAIGLGRGAADLARDRGAARHERWLEITRDALDMAQMPYDIVDEQCSAEMLARYRAVVMPTPGRVDRAAWKRLGQAAATGTLAVVGPARPQRDELDRPLDDDAALPGGAGLIRARSMDDVEGFADDLIGLVEARPARPPDTWVCEQADIACSLFVDGHGAARVMFALNQSARAERVELLVPAGTRLRDPLDGQEFSGPSGTAPVEMEPYQARMLVVE